MHVQPVVAGLQAALVGHGELAGAEPAVEAAAGHLAELLGPALRQAALDLAEQAASEVRAQLPDRTVDVVLVDGDPVLRIGDAVATRADTTEELDARITLRLPPSLKKLVEDLADSAGDSVNTWVVDQLSARAKSSTKRGFRGTRTFDL